MDIPSAVTAVDNMKVLLQLMKDDPHAAANQLDEMASKLRELATILRTADYDNSGTRSIAGTADRVQISVVGPDGAVKHTVDTNER